MCLYPKLVQNPRYKPNKKNGGVVPECDDVRKMTIPAECGRCAECRKKKVREWRIRIEWENKTNPDPVYYVTFSFSEEALDDMPNDANVAAERAVRKWVYRCVKATGKSPKYWLCPELGPNNTERLHLHGVIWTKYPEHLEKWGYGNVKVEKCTEDTVGYCTKYILKPDEIHPEFFAKMICSKGIGKGFLKSEDAQQLIRKKDEDKEFLRTKTGKKINVPQYWRRQLFSDETLENKWIRKLDKEVMYVNGEKLPVSNTEEWAYFIEAQEEERRRTERLGYPKFPWNKKNYMETRKKVQKNLQN
ncbi:replication initiator protein [Dipodfec virus UOA04_Rod_565]|nr:replication initiator protein [Dipodfec virus UOA04_Rod_565]